MNNVPEKEGEVPFTVPVSPLESMTKQPATSSILEFPAKNINNPLSQYFNGSFVDLLHQNKFHQSLKSKDIKDWSSTAAKQCEDFEWSQYQITTLLEYYSRYPQLWDTKHEQYMNKDVRRQLITTLSETVGAPEAAVNVKFQRLRVHFSRELRKEESSAHEPQPYQSKWKYYSNMLFLRDTLRCRQKSRQHTSEKDSLSLTMDTPPCNGSSGSKSTSNLVITSTCTISSDSGHSSPDSTSLVSPSVSHSENKENVSPVRSRVPCSPLSPSLISTPFSTLPTSLVPPLLASNPLFSSLSTSLPTPPASLLSSFASLEHLLSPRMLAPLLMNNKGGGSGVKQEQGPFNPLLTQTPGTLLAPTPQIPSSPLTPNVVCSAPSFWGTPNREDEDTAAMKSYQAKRQRLGKHSTEGLAPRDHTSLLEHMAAASSHNFVTSSESIMTSSESIMTSLDGGSQQRVSSSSSECDYFSLHVSDSLRRMDIICAEECKRAIQNTIYQYIVKSCQRQSYNISPNTPYQPRYKTPGNGVRMVNRKP